MKSYFNEIIKDVCTKKFWSRFIVMTISTFVFALNYNTFLLPNNLVTGGTSGIAILVNHYFEIEPSLFIFIFNAIILFLSFFIMGPRSTGMALLGSLIFPLSISLTKNLGQYLSEVIVFQDFILTVILAGFISGITTGLIFRTGYSTSGNDIIVLMVNKYFKIPTGLVSLILNIIIVSIGCISFGLGKTIYAVVIIIISSLMIDKVMNGISESKMFYITTTKMKEVKRFIRESQSGYTIIKTESGYTNKEDNIIMCVVPTRDYYLFKMAIEEIDPQVFLVISDCYEVYGGKRKHNFPFL